MLSGGKLVYQYQKKPVKIAKCAATGAQLNGVSTHSTILYNGCKPCMNAVLFFASEFRKRQAELTR
jgi:hypothetical protein